MTNVHEYLTGKGIIGKESYKVYKQWKKETGNRISCTTWLNLDYTVLTK